MTLPAPRLLRTLSPTACKVYMVLQTLAQRDRVCASVPAIAAAAGLSPRTVKSALADLRGHALIRRLPRRPTAPDAYDLAPSPSGWHPDAPPAGQAVAQRVGQPVAPQTGALARKSLSGNDTSFFAQNPVGQPAAPRVRAASAPTDTLTHATHTPVGPAVLDYLESLLDPSQSDESNKEAELALLDYIESLPPDALAAIRETVPPERLAALVDRAHATLARLDGHPA